MNEKPLPSDHPEDIPEEVRREIIEDEAPAVSPEIKGEEVKEPSVPLREGMDPNSVTVTRLEPDHSQRDAIREEERSRAAGRRVRLDLNQSLQGGVGGSSGRRGRAGRKQDS